MKRSGIVLILSILLVYIFLIGPLVIIGFSAFNESEFLDFPPKPLAIFTDIDTADRRFAAILYPENFSPLY